MATVSRGRDLHIASFAIKMVPPGAMHIATTKLSFKELSGAASREKK